MTDPLDLDLLPRLSDERVRLAAHAASRAVALAAGRHRFSGFVWRPGLVVTADEALPEDAEVRAALAGPEGGAARTAGATVVGRDASTDVALLRVEAGDEAAVAFSEAPLAVGASVLVAGADGHGPLVVGGAVSRVGPEWRSLRGGRIDARVELDLRLPRTAEGAAVHDARGRAIGMAVTGPRRRTLLIPAATVERVAAALERDGRIARGRIGAALQTIALDGGGHGLAVASVEPDGPAARAGLCQGDLVVGIDGEPPGPLRAMMARLGPGSVGTELVLAVRRGGEDREIPITIDERPDD